MRSKGGKTLAVSIVASLLGCGVLLGVGVWRWPALWGVLPVVAVWLIMRHRTAGFLALACFGMCFAVGWLRASAVATPLQHAALVFDSTQTIRGVVMDDPSYVQGGQTEVYVTSLQLKDGQRLPGKLRLRGYVIGLSRGDRVVATGKLRSGFGSYIAAMYYATIQITGHDSSWIAHFRRRFQAGIFNALPDPQASFVFGLLVGARSGLPDSLNAQLAAVGLMHLVAVSGYNLTILVRASRSFTRYLSPMISVLMAAALIIAFLLVTGFSASIVRAAIVSGLSLVASYFGREPKPVPLLLLSAAITALLSPIYLWSDLGWWLSFLAFVGVLLLGPEITARLKHEPRAWQQILIETMSAILLTTPIIMFTFSRVSLIAPLTNLIVLPFIPVSMLLGFIAGLVGMVAPTVSWLFAGPARLLLGLMVKFIERSGSVSWAERTMGLSATGMAVAYGLIFLLYVLLHSINRKNHAIITDRSKQE